MMPVKLTPGQTRLLEAIHDNEPALIAPGYKIVVGRRLDRGPFRGFTPVQARPAVFKSLAAKGLVDKRQHVVGGRAFVAYEATATGCAVLAERNKR